TAGGYVGIVRQSCGYLGDRDMQWLLASERYGGLPLLSGNLVAMPEPGPLLSLARGRSKRARMLLIPALALVLVGGFLLWGPVGLGNGPLNVQMAGLQTSTAWGNGPVGFALPLHNSGGAPAVVDGVELVGGTQFPGPRLLGLGVLTNSNCGGAWPA